MKGKRKTPILNSKSKLVSHLWNKIETHLWVNDQSPLSAAHLSLRAARCVRWFLYLFCVVVFISTYWIWTNYSRSMKARLWPQSKVGVLSSETAAIGSRLASLSPNVDFLPAPRQWYNIHTLYWTSIWRYFIESDTLIWYSYTLLHLVKESL